MDKGEFIKAISKHNEIIAIYCGDIERENLIMIIKDKLPQYMVQMIG